MPKPPKKIPTIPALIKKTVKMFKKGKVISGLAELYGYSPKTPGEKAPIKIIIKILIIKDIIPKKKKNKGPEKESLGTPKIL